MNRGAAVPDVVVRVTGGLGNQLFQFSAGLAVSKRLGARLRVDASAYAKDPLRRYRLDCLAEPPEQVSEQELQSLLQPGWIARKLLRKRPLRVIRHLEASYRPEVQVVAEGCYLDGYWQSQEYFRPIRDEIRSRLQFQSSLSPSNGQLASLAQAKRVASLHVRRGDYVAVPSLRDWHGVLPLEYYERALELLDSRFGLEGVFVFTDDPEWVRSNLATELPMTIVSNGKSDELEELSVMKSCRYHVIANSSYSWWGAWLSDAEPAAIVAPSQWFATDKEDASAIVPSEWNLV